MTEEERKELAYLLMYLDLSSMAREGTLNGQGYQAVMHITEKYPDFSTRKSDLCKYYVQKLMEGIDE